MTQPFIPQRIMAIDYGTKRIGIALTDPLLTFAYPYKTLLNDDKLWKNLAEIISEQDVAKIILGYPLRLNGEHAPITDEVVKFKATLEKKYKLEVILQDERFSSSLAQEQIIQSVTKKKKRRDKGLLDRNSAAIILQDYLNENGV